MTRSARQHSVALRGMTPFVDTIFLLVFSLLALSEARRPQPTELVRVELPLVERGEQARPAPTERIVLQVTAQSQVLFGRDGVPIGSREELDHALAEARGELLPEEQVVEIEADRDARHGVAVELLQHLRLAGFVHVRLVATGEARPAGPFGGAR